MPVACPWFKPLKEADFFDRPRPARAPLGAVFAGECHARPDSVRVPPAEILYEACNFGYGRGRCPEFPPDSEADAVRFTSVGERSVWVLEKEFGPVRHGSCNGPFPSELVREQAEAFQSACRKS